jgi:hypothetical protein
VPSPYIEPAIRVEHCECGGAVVVYGSMQADIRQAVTAHNGVPAHLIWRRWMAR